MRDQETGSGIPEVNRNSGSDLPKWDTRISEGGNGNVRILEMDYWKKQKQEVVELPEVLNHRKSMSHKTETEHWCVVHFRFRSVAYKRRREAQVGL